MANETTSGELSGAPGVSTDLVRIARGGSNFKLTLAEIVAGGYIDITWANLLTAIGGGTLTPLAWYHITNSPDGSSTIDEAWLQARDVDEIFPMGMGNLNTSDISNRTVDVLFYMEGGVGGRIAGVYDSKKNVVEGYSVTSGGTSSTANIDTWLNTLTAANQSVKVYGSVLTGGGGANTIGDFSELIGATVQILGNSNLYGSVLGGSVNLDNGSNANGVYILGGGGLVLDNASTFATGFIGAGKTITLTGGESIVGFSTERNIAIQHGGANPSGDTIIVDAATGTVFVDDGSTDVTITMPTGVISGQRMTIFFLLGSPAVTWNGATTDPSTFIAAPVTGQKIEAFWDALNTTWR